MSVKSLKSGLVSTNLLLDNESPFPSIEYLVIAGGGAGTDDIGGGGGAGGYRSAVTGELSGGGVNAEDPLIVGLGTNITVTVGAGAPRSGSPTRGSNSVFGSITSIGGGGGATFSTNAQTGGSGAGGSMGRQTGGVGTVNQGRNGGNGDGPVPNGTCGGGGGAGTLGGNANTPNAGNGGNGLESSISGTATFRAGGGGGGVDNNISGRTPGDGGIGGGGDGDFTNTFATKSGQVSTGSGGAGGNRNSGGLGGSGGSGIVVFRYSQSFTISVGAGLTSTTSIVSGKKVTTFTAGTGTVSWAA